MVHWLAVGPFENWKESIAKEHKWGFEPHHERAWMRISTDDVLLFYVVNPVKGIVGYGRIAHKVREDEPFWSLERAQSHTMWPLRLYLDTVTILPPLLWTAHAVRVDRSIIVPRRAIQLIQDDKAAKLMDDLQEALAKVQD